MVRPNWPLIVRLTATCPNCSSTTTDLEVTHQPHHQVGIGNRQSFTRAACPACGNERQVASIAHGSALPAA